VTQCKDELAGWMTQVPDLRLVIRRIVAFQKIFKFLKMINAILFNQYHYENSSFYINMLISSILGLVRQTQSSVCEDFPLSVAERSRSKGVRVGKLIFNPFKYTR